VSKKRIFRLLDHLAIAHNVQERITKALEALGSVLAPFKKRLEAEIVSCRRRRDRSVLSLREIMEALTDAEVDRFRHEADLLRTDLAALGVTDRW
jgi:hypothetical protein